MTVKFLALDIGGVPVVRNHISYLKGLDLVWHLKSLLQRNLDQSPFLFGRVLRPHFLNALALA